MVRLMIISTLAFVLMPGMASSASLIKDFVGRWPGQSIEQPYNATPSGIIDIEINESSNGFELSWNDLSLNDRGVPDGNALEARFVGTNRQGVFEVVPESGSFLDQMFASPETGNPLDGETLLWARIDTETLAVYSLKIDETGEFNLDHYSWTRTDGGLALLYRKQTQVLGEETLLKGQLVAAGE